MAGVERVWIDPGIGFGKTGAHNLSLLRHLDALVSTGWPVLVGTSRKSFLADLASGDGEVASAARPLGGHGSHDHLGHRSGSGHGPSPRCSPGTPRGCPGPGCRA